MHGLGDWLTNAGRITGLLAGYAVVVLLALMARVPALERGRRRRPAGPLARDGRPLHRLPGRRAHPADHLGLRGHRAHGRGQRDRRRCSLSYPDVLMATVALGLLRRRRHRVSARAARRRLRYETWYYLHLYTYLAIALAFSHQFADRRRLHRPTGRAGALVGDVRRGRGAAALVPARASRCARGAAAPAAGRRGACARRRASSRSASAAEHLDELARRAGPVLPLAVPDPRAVVGGQPVLAVGRAAARPAADHRQEPRRPQRGAARGCSPGTRVFAEGPYGAFTAARRSRRKVLLIAGGVGITPLRALFETLPGPATSPCSTGPAAREDVVFRDELDAIAAARGAPCTTWSGPGPSSAATRCRAG